MKLDKKICELLHDHDCVIIPKFGGFVANKKVAHIHPRQHIVNPPSKQISFNKNLTSNDGLLSNYLAQKENISYAAALAFVESSVEKYKKELAEGKRVEFEGLGVIYKDRSDNIRFLPHNTENFLKESFGLSKVYFKPIEELTSEIEETKETPVVPIAQPVKKKRKLAWIAAAVITIPLLVTSAFFLDKNMSGGQNLNLANFNPFSSSRQAEFQPRFEEEGIAFANPIDESNGIEKITESNPDLASVYYSFSEDKVSPDGVKVKLKDEEVPTLNELSNLKLYFIVGGAFREKSNAEGLVNKLKGKGFDAYIFGMKGDLHMVCYGSYANKSAARKALKEVKQNENKNAWLKRN